VSEPQQPSKRVNPTVSTGREREETLPGRVQAEPRLSATELSTTRKLIWLTSAAATAFALIAIVVFQLLISALRGNIHAVGAGPRVECVEDGEPGCGEGQVCRNFRCVDDVYTAPETCEVGDACGPGVCACGPRLTCEQGKCAAPDIGEAVCSQPAVIGALVNLRAKCAGDIDECPKSDLKKYAIENPDFDQLMSEFPGTVTLHFPGGKPPLGKGEEPRPPADVRAYYLERLAPALPMLTAARHVFIISRSSAQGNSRRNDAFAQARSALTKSLILEALTAGGGGDVQARDAMRGKFADFLLGPKKQIDAALFKSRYANRAITWSDTSQRMLRALIERPQVGAEDELWRSRVINQVVFVVPVPCELTPQGGG
jgi:hypothetical protein